MASRSEIRAIKRSRYAGTHPDDPDWEVLTPVPAGPHAPNSNEARVLRRLMSQTGLTEARLREHKCYRVELSQAQKACGTKTQVQRLALRVRKSVTRELQLPREHPQVREAFNAAWQMRTRYMYARSVPSADEAWGALKGL